MRAAGALLALGLTLAQAPPASAGLTEADLSGVAMRPAPDAQIPADIPFTNDSGAPIALGAAMRGRATLLVVVDYACRSVCGPILASTAATIRNSGLAAGHDFNLVVIGLDPSRTRADAAAMKAAQLGGDPGLAASAHFLNGDAAALQRLWAALGYRALYDADARRYAHPTDLIVLTPDRRVSRLLPGFAVRGDDLRFALVEAGGGAVAALIDRARVLCYGLDPAHGVYNARVRIALIGGAGATLVGLGLLAGGAQRRRRRLIDGGRP
jgi:protein SCO1